LYKDGKELLKTPFKKRREILKKILPSKNKTIILSPQMVSSDPEKLRRYHDQQIKKGLEGSVVKKWEAPYDPGRRGYTWVKFKQEKGKKGGGLADTLDCLLMGYYKGRGKRAEFGLGAFLVGVRKKGKFLTISKIGTGLSDKQWQEMYQRCQKVKTEKKPDQFQVVKDLYPDTWCQPEIVVEIEADNITKSPTHTAKYALRFPRLVRFRDDKGPDQATTLAEAEKLYRLQK
jgi:DNA ligase-1